MGFFKKLFGVQEKVASLEDEKDLTSVWQLYMNEIDKNVLQERLIAEQEKLIQHYSQLAKHAIEFMSYDYEGEEDAEGLLEVTPENFMKIMRDMMPPDLEFPDTDNEGPAL